MTLPVGVRGHSPTVGIYGPEILLPLLGTMPALWIAKWSGNTVTGGKLETWQNIVNPGTLDLDQGTDGNRATYNATGWNSTTPTGDFGFSGAQWYRVDGLAAHFTGDDLPITIVTAIEFANPPSYFDTVLGLTTAADHTQGRHSLDFDNTGKWRTIRGNTLGAFKTSSDAVPSGREIIISTLASGTTLTTWRNGVKASNAVDLDVAAVAFDAAAVGAFPSGAGISDNINNARIGLLGCYTTAFNDAQAASATAAISLAYPTA